VQARPIDQREPARLNVPKLAIAVFRILIFSFSVQMSSS
jgi:hypothetical protein